MLYLLKYDVAHYFLQQEHFDSLLKAQYPVCYNIAVKIVKMIQNKLQRKVYESEVVYLTMHIQHFEHYSK